MGTPKLNGQEVSVLQACKKQIVDYTGCEFGCVGRIEKGGLTENQMKGYLSQLVQKGLICIFENDESPCFKLTTEGCDFLLSHTTMESDIEQLNEIRDNL